MYDAIVVGARCAGSPTALLLARKGYRVLLVDRATFPSDVVNGYYIHQPGVACLRRWGVLGQLPASTCPPIGRFTLDLGDFALPGAPPPADGIAEGYPVRRIVLDKILVDAAGAAGVELREQFAVRELVREGERVVGIRGQAPGGAVVTERARVVIGADGTHSLVARAVQAPLYHARPALTFWYYTHWSGVPLQRMALYPRDRRLVIIIPTNDGLVTVAVAWPHAEFQQFRADIAGNYFKTLALIPGLTELVHSGRQEERFLGTADVANFFRKPYGPGWALVGDAGYHKDPHTAQGISDAFRDAELLTRALDEGFSGRRPPDEALADYERQRNAAVLPMYELTCRLASLEVSPTEGQLFSALRENQPDTDRFFGVIAGTVPVPEFFAPENLQRILKAAGNPATRVA